MSLLELGGPLAFHGYLDPAVGRRVVGTYCGRWSIGTTYQECRSCAGPETMWWPYRRTVVRAAQSPFGLSSVVVVLTTSSTRAGGSPGRR
jgi:hypothetical protein